MYMTNPNASAPVTNTAVLYLTDVFVRTNFVTPVPGRELRGVSRDETALCCTLGAAPATLVIGGTRPGRVKTDNVLFPRESILPRTGCMIYLTREARLAEISLISASVSRIPSPEPDT